VAALRTDLTQKTDHHSIERDELLAHRTTEDRQHQRELSELSTARQQAEHASTHPQAGQGSAPAATATLPIDPSGTRSMMSNAQLNRIPSIELQLFKWISLVGAAEIPDCVELKRAGTRIWIKHARQPLAGFGEVVPVLTLSNIQLNPRLKGRGWLTEFVELCDTLIPWPALFVERVQNPRLPTFLKRKGFIELQHANFYRPSKAWRTRHGWLPEQALAAQQEADRAHVRPLWEDADAIAQFNAHRKEINR